MWSPWSFISKSDNRVVLGWLGGAAVALASGGWAVVTYVWPHHEAPAAAAAAPTVCARQGIAIGGSVSGSTVTNTASGAGGSGSCTGAAGSR